jgi:hypothetical protein
MLRKIQKKKKKDQLRTRCCLLGEEFLQEKKKNVHFHAISKFTLNGENSLIKLRPTLLNATIGKNFVE